MRVIGRVLLGTLAIVFAMAFLARLVRRPRRRGTYLHAPALPRARPQAAQPSSSGRHASAVTCLAALPGGSGWGRLVVPPSSRSRTLRRNGRGGVRGLDRQQRARARAFYQRG